jgi:hypothetical protein
MRSYKKKYNKNNKHTKKKYIKGGFAMPKGGMPGGIPDPTKLVAEGLKLLPLITKLLPYINQAKTVGKTIIEKYLSKDPGELAILGTNILNKLQSDVELINLIKNDTNDFRVIYQKFISILKEFEPEAIKLYEGIISVFCSEIKSINSILNNSQIKPFITPVKIQINSFIGIVEGKMPAIVAEIEKVEPLKEMVPKITKLIRKMFDILKGEIDQILIGACSIADPKANMLETTALAASSSAFSAVEVASLRHTRKIKKTRKEPIEKEADITEVEPEKIKGTLRTSSETIQNDDNEFTAIINIPTGLDIDVINIEFQYPLRVDVNVETNNEPETLRFIAETTIDDVIYSLPSSVKAKDLDMNNYTFNKFLIGKTELNNGKDADIKLVNFEFKKLYGKPIYVFTDKSQYYDEKDRLYANNRVPIKMKSNIMSVFPKKIKKSLISEDKYLKIKRTDSTIEYTFKKNNGIEIKNFKYKIDYPPKVWIDAGVNGKQLLFVLDTTSGKVLYRLASDQTVDKDEMTKTTLPPNLKGAIEIDENGRTNMKQINLVNFVKSFKKTSSTFKLPGNLFNANSDTQQPIYVLN